MDNRSPNLAEVLRAAMRREAGNIHTALPGRIESYDAARQTANIKPLLKLGEVDGEGNEILDTLPVIPSVPIVFPRAGGFYLSFPLAPGDKVLLVFCERSIDRWFASDGADTDPIDLRRHALSDAVAFPGFYPLQDAFAAHSTNMVLGKDGGPQIHLTPGGQVHLGAENPTEFVALATKVLTELQAVQADQVALKALLVAHVHPGVTAGGASTSPSPAFVPYLPHTPLPVAATTTKAL